MDKLMVINKALLKCGLPLAAALEDCDWNAGLVYDICTEEVLRSFPWGFAQKFSVVSQSTKPEHGFKFGYTMPDDCLRVIDVHCAYDLRSPKARYVVSYRKIYANVSPCNLRYVEKMLDPSDWPMDFADAVAFRIAFEIAPLSTQTMGLTPQLAQLYQYSLANAQATDARENAERVPLDINILAARAGVNSQQGR